MTEYRAAMRDAVANALTVHLQRSDRQEDICFGLYRLGTGETSSTALLFKVVLPDEGDRNVHGNASFNACYLERVLGIAARQECGVVLLHSHPLGRGWQGMSADDVKAECGIAPAVYGATSLPLLGMTQAGDDVWSARFWVREGFRKFARCDCSRVRIVGRRFHVDFNDLLDAPPSPTTRQTRTVSAWGDIRQSELARLRVGVVGAGSVGGVVAEGLARMGVQRITTIDFDIIEDHNLDRLTYANGSDVGELKVDALHGYLELAATGERLELRKIPQGIGHSDAIKAALDCDVLFSCVDRPLGRHILNQIAYAHLIPVVDGGIAIRRNRSGMLAAADWRAHVVAPERACLRCLGQYEFGMVQAEREGTLDDPAYIESLPEGHPLKARQNVFAFSVACASRQLLQFLSMALEPLGLNRFGAEHYHFVGDFWEPKAWPRCRENCPIERLTAEGDRHLIQ